MTAEKPSEWSMETVETIAILTGGTFNDGNSEIAAAFVDRQAQRKAVAPAMRELWFALAAALDEWGRNTCIHEDTARGGVEWTICQQCGMKWSDRDGGFKPYEEPPKIAGAHATLSYYRHLIEGEGE